MKGTELERLGDGAERLIRENEPFLKGEPGNEYLDEDEASEYVEPVSNGDADLSALKSKLEEIKERYDPGTGSMDGEAAEAVREHIQLTRAQAADSDIWNDLSIRKFPWFVRHRWGYEGETAMRKKFWTEGVALDSQSCTFERLWWIAELTRREDGDEFDYTYTHRVFSTRRFSFRVFDIKMGRYIPAVHALIEVLYDEGESEDEGGFVRNDVIDGVIQRFRKSGAAMPYEGRDKSKLVEALEDIRANVEEELSEGE